MKVSDTNEKKGKVWLVGAGPGDAGLLTLKGSEALHRAEAVIYDDVISESVLSLIPDTAEIICAGDHDLKQEEADQLMLDKALKGFSVARLESGDPFVFGRGEEETRLLAQNGVPYEIVPGVTSPFAVPAYAGIPVTGRDACSSVHVIDGHRRKDNTYDIDFAALTEAGGTLVFLNAAASLHVIASGLLSAGMDPDTPAAVIEKGTAASQRRISSTVSELEKAAEDAGAAEPAVVVIGDAAGHEYEWRSSLPLAGCRTVIAVFDGPEPVLSEILREKGAEVIVLPLIRLVPAEDLHTDKAYKKVRNREYEWLVFTSPGSVRSFLRKYLEKYDIRTLSYCSIACIGRGTETELAGYGIKPDMIPTKQDTFTPGEELARRLRAGDRVLIPGEGTEEQELVDELSTAYKVQIDYLPFCDTEYVSPEWFDAVNIFEDMHTYAVFTSPAAVCGFVRAWPETDFASIKAVCIDSATAREAAKHGMEYYISDGETPESLSYVLEKLHGRE